MITIEKHSVGEFEKVLTLSDSEALINQALSVQKKK
jgi:hypothetical protein